MADAPDARGPDGRDAPRGCSSNRLAVAELAMSSPDAVSVDFEFGLDLILDGLDRIRVGPA